MDDAVEYIKKRSVGDMQIKWSAYTLEHTTELQRGVRPGTPKYIGAANRCNVYGVIIGFAGALRWSVEPADVAMSYGQMTPSDLPLEDLKKQVETVMRMGVTTCK